MNRSLFIKTIIYSVASLIIGSLLFVILWQSNKVKQQNDKLQHIDQTLAPILEEIQALEKTHHALDANLNRQLDIQSNKSLRIKQLKEELTSLEASIAQSSRELSILDKERSNFLKLSHSIKSTLSSLNISKISEIKKTKKTLQREVKNMSLKVAKLESSLRKIQSSSASQEPHILATVVSINPDLEFLIIDKGSEDKFIEKVDAQLPVTRHGKHIRNVKIEKIHLAYSVCNFLPSPSHVTPTLKVGDKITLTPAPSK